jgi:hypothetical protein
MAVAYSIAACRNGVLQPLVADVVVVRGDDLAAGETEHVRIIHSGLEGEKEYALVVSARGLWLRYVGRRRLDLPPSRQRARIVNLEPPR